MWFSLAFAFEMSDLSWRGAPYTVVRVEGSDTLSLVGQEGRTGVTLGEALTQAGPGAIAVNGGMYHPGHTPVGLHVEAGVQHAPLVRGAKGGNFGLLPNGVFAVGPRGASVQTTPRYRGPTEHATQSGPMLVIDGALHPAFREQSPNLRIRNGVGVTNDGDVWLVISREPVRFWDLATLFRDRLGCPDALYLDGTVSELATDPSHRGRRFSSALVVSPSR